MLSSQKETGGRQDNAVVNREGVCVGGGTHTAAKRAAAPHPPSPAHDRPHSARREFASSCAQPRTFPRGTEKDPLPQPHPGHHFSSLLSWSLTTRGQGLSGPVSLAVDTITEGTHRSSPLCFSRLPAPAREGVAVGGQAETRQDNRGHFRTQF